MGESRSIRWHGDSNNNDSESFERDDPQTGPRAYRRRDSDTDANPMDACRLRRLESYPSSHAMASTASLESSASAETDSEESEIDKQDHTYCNPRPAPLRYSTPDVLPATSLDFAELFPTSRKLVIRHDDTTLDGNMNLRVDAPITTERGSQRDITLFHLRMYDLKCRDFSLRRYCRESGREVCHCARKSHKSLLGARPNIQRSLSNAFAAILPKHEQKQQSQHSQHQQQQQATLKRHDSGYDTMHSDNEQDPERPHSSHSNKAPAKDAVDLINLEFSNYAHVDLKRRGFKADKRYDFDYWGYSYSWHRSTQKMGTSQEVSYHLTRRDGSLVARIVPEGLSDVEAEEEIDKGGWVPQCSLRIVDKKINEERLADIAEVIVSTGLIMLVDDSIRRRFHRQEARGHTFHLPRVIKGRIDAKTRTASTAKIAGSYHSVELPHRKLLASSV